MIDAFVACKPDFFPVLAANAKAFGPASVKEYPPRGGIATFTTPVDIRGLHVVSFYLSTPPKSARKGVQPGYYNWGFQVTETAQDAAKTISGLAKSADFEERRGEFGWVMDLEPNWHTQNDGTAIEHRSPLRMMLIRPARAPAAGSTIDCGVMASQMAGHETMPKVSAMFGAAP